MSKFYLHIVYGLIASTATISIAQQSDTAPAPAPVLVPAEAALATVAPTQSSRIHLNEGTEVTLQFADGLSSATNTEGDRFNLRVDGDVKVGGVVAIKSGSVAVGRVTSARKKGYMGKAGELNVTLDYVSVGDERVRLRANKGKEGDAKVGATVALTVLFGPLGLLKRGHDIEIKSGTPIVAYIDQSADVAVTP
jgi:hypothetical protein